MLSNTQASPLAQAHTVVYEREDPRFFIDGCSLLKNEDGRLLACIPVVPRGACFDKKTLAQQRVQNSRVHILESSDQGESWNRLCSLPYYAAVLWSHQQRLYLFANKGGAVFRNDDLLLLESRDAGDTWSDPVTLYTGHFWNIHTAMVEKEDKLYWAVDDLSYGDCRGPCVVAGDLTKEVMNARNWRISNTVPFAGVHRTFSNPAFSDLSSKCLEPNVIQVGGKLRVLATVKINRQTVTGLCAVYDVQTSDHGVTLKFVQYHPMPGGHLKFFIIWDPISNLFWSVVNLAADGQNVMDWPNEPDYATHGGNDRRFLMLMYGVDGLNWFPAGCIAKADRLSRSFMYPTAVIDNDDLLVISRTSKHASNRHDADMATFHRISQFRRLAMELRPNMET